VTWWRDIQPLQEPFDLGVEEDTGRAQFAFNVFITKRPSAAFIPELVKILVTAGVGTEDVNIFATSKAVIPTGKGPYLSVKPTGGAGPLGTHNDGPGAYRRPSVQVVARASTWQAAEAMAQAAYTALIDVRNQAVVA
jgi:hypothetical protein